MKMMTTVLIIAMAASAVAQSPSTVANVRDRLAGVKPAGGAVAGTVKAAPKPAAPATTPVATAPKTAAPKPTVLPKQPVAPKLVAKPAAVPVKVAAKPKLAPTVTPKPAVKPAVQAPEKPKRVKLGAEGRRDPFVSPVVQREDGGTRGCASGGKKCLVADQIALKGIVRTNGANIAVVVTADNRAYFLHENDPIYNGVVTKIGENSVTFREQVKDVLGKPAMREVVKKINTPA